nr:hypothetical protein [uncultured Lichenicoccus sp.]
MAFQTTMNVTQAPGVPGDFASLNPRHSVPSVPGGFVAGANGVTIGLFCWADTATGTLLSNTGTGVPTGFLARTTTEGLNTTYLSDVGMTIPAGFGVGELFNGGDFWVKNAGTAAVTIGLKAFANLTNGTISFAATGSTVTGAIETKWIAMSAGAVGELIKMSNTPLG